MIETNATNDTELSQYIYDLHLLSLPVIITIEALIIVVGLLGNVLVIFIVIKVRRMQTYTNWLILNLSLGDLLVTLICIPFDIALLIHGEWVFGKYLCRIYYPLGTTVMSNSVFSIVALNCSRYWAIARPYRHQPTISDGKKIICLIWTLSALTSLPQMFSLTYNDEFEVCYETWTEKEEQIYATIIFTFTCVFPLVATSVTYTLIVNSLKSPRKISYVDNRKLKENYQLITLSIVITATFTICVVPNQIVWILHSYTNFDDLMYANDIRIGAYLLSFLNSALNPIVFNVFSGSFRKAFGDLWTKCFRAEQAKQREQHVCRYTGNDCLVTYNM